MKSFLIALLVVFGCVLVGGGAFILSGIYDVGAAVPHWKATFLLLEALRERSIDVHSEGIEVPPLNSGELVDEGFPHFHDMCRLCHGAPGYPREEFADGLYPSPPDLKSRDVQEENDDRALYWIVKNGLKMTGMPSFGKTHTEKQLWGIVAVVRRLLILDPKEYQGMVERVSKKEAGEDSPPQS